MHAYSNRRSQCILLAKPQQMQRKGFVAIGLELFAVAWDVEKFHHFLYASHFILETDKKLLKQFLKRYQPSNTQVVKNFDQDIPLSFYNTIHTRIGKPASRFLIQIR